MQRPKLISQRWPSVLQLSIFISQKLEVPESHSAVMYKHLTEHRTSLGWKLESHSRTSSQQTLLKLAYIAPCLGLELANAAPRLGIGKHWGLSLKPQVSEI